MMTISTPSSASSVHNENRIFGRCPAPLLQVQPTANLDKLEPDPSALFALWAVFSKAKNAISQGERLENMSWRLWMRELQCISSEIRPKEISSEFEDLSADTSNSISQHKNSIDLTTGPQHHSHQSQHQRAAALRRAKFSGEQLDQFFRMVNKDAETANGVGATRHDLFPSVSSALSNLSTLSMPKGPERTNTDTTISSVNTDTTSKLDSSNSPSYFNHPGEGSSKSLEAPRGSSSVSKPVGSDAPDAATRRSRLEMPTSSHRRSPSVGKSAVAAKRRASFGPTKRSKSSSQVASGSRQSLQGLAPSATLATKTTTPSLFRSHDHTHNQTHQFNIAPLTRLDSRSQCKSRSEASTSAEYKLLQRQTSGLFNKDIAGHESLSTEEDAFAEDNSDSDGESRGRSSLAAATSVVRGFSPSNVSVSVITRVPSHKKLEEHDFNQQQKPPAEWKPTKARPDNLAREKMFFIESSPSDNEGVHGSESFSSSESQLKHLMGQTNSHLSAVNRSITASHGQEPHEPAAHSPLRKKTNPPPSLFEQNPNSAKRRIQMQLDDDEDDDDFEDENDDLTDEHEETDGVDDDRSDHDDDDDENDSAWDSVDDESDSSFDAETIFEPKEELESRPLMRPSLLSSLFLNKSAEHATMARDRQERQEAYAHQNQNSTTSSRPAQDTAMLEGNLSMPALRSKSQSSTSTLSRKLNPAAGILEATLLTHAGPGANRKEPTRPPSPSKPASEAETKRKQMQWEKVQETDNVNERPLRRSHTSIGVYNLAKPFSAKDDSWKQDMDERNLDFNYHARGW